MRATARTRERSGDMGMRLVFAMLVMCVLVGLLSSPTLTQGAESTMGDIGNGKVVGVADLLIVLEGAAKDDASISTAEFLAPEARNSPSRRAPPRINNLSIQSPMLHYFVLPASDNAS